MQSLRIMPTDRASNLSILKFCPEQHPQLQFIFVGIRLDYIIQITFLFVRQPFLCQKLYSPETQQIKSVNLRYNQRAQDIQQRSIMESRSYSQSYQRELELVQSGGDASTLALLIRDFYLSPAASKPIPSEEVLTHLSCLLIGHQFHQLSYVTDRYVFTPKNEGIILELELFSLVADRAIACEYEQMLGAVVRLVDVTTSALKARFLPSARSYIIRKLSQDYSTFPLDRLISKYNIPHEELAANGCRVEGQFVNFTQPSRLSGVAELMLERINQLATLTEQVIQHEEKKIR